MKARLRSFLRKMFLEMTDKCCIWAIETFRGDGAVNEWFLFLFFLMPTFILTMWLIVRLWLAHFPLLRGVGGQCNFDINGLLALQDADKEAERVIHSAPEQLVKTEEAELSSISERTESSEGKSSRNSVGSFQVVSAIAISSDEECSSISSAKSELFAVGADGS